MYEFNVDKYLTSRSKRSSNICYKTYHSNVILNQSEDCADGNISAETYNEIAAQNTCVVASRRMYFMVPNNVSMVYYSPDGFSCLMCLPINCGDIENLGRDCSKYAIKSRYRLSYINDYRQMIVTLRYECITDCGHPRTNRYIRKATILGNGTLIYF